MLIRDSSRPFVARWCWAQEESTSFGAAPKILGEDSSLFRRFAQPTNPTLQVNDPGGPALIAKRRRDPDEALAIDGDGPARKRRRRSKTPEREFECPAEGLGRAFWD